MIANVRYTIDDVVLAVERIRIIVAIAPEDEHSIGAKHFASASANNSSLNAESAHGKSSAVIPCRTTATFRLSERVPATPSMRMS